MKENLLEIKGLSVEFRIYEGVVKAINNLNLSVPRKKTIGLVGETGAGKTTTALSIMRLIPKPPGMITSGEILFEGKDLLSVSNEEIHKLRGNRIAMIFQNPMTSLNPVLTIGQQVGGIISLHQDISASEAQKRAGELLEIVQIPKSRLKSYPHEFSGGMRQRVCIAMGLAHNPQLLIADEPTTALDVTIQAQILDLMDEIKNKFDTSILFITHALGVVAEIADYVAVMYAGSIIEYGSLESVFTNPCHPYTQGLFSCIPDIESKKSSLTVIRGSMPDPMNLPKGCKFRERCEYAMDICFAEEPKEITLEDGHKVKCHLYQEEKKV